MNSSGSDKNTAKRSLSMSRSQSFFFFEEDESLPNSDSVVSATSANESVLTNAKRCSYKETQSRYKPYHVTWGWFVNPSDSSEEVYSQLPPKFPRVLNSIQEHHDGADESSEQGNIHATTSSACKG